MDRIYTTAIQNHLAEYRQMAFIAGPRQVGKTTCSKMVAEAYPVHHYLNWDNPSHRKFIIKGAEVIAEHYQFVTATKNLIIMVFDEIHKYRKWKLFLKGFFDLYEDQTRSIITGSTKLDVYRRDGDSLMGRYFLYRMHPLSVAELLTTIPRTTEIIDPKPIATDCY